ncbi:MAG: ATP-binding protein [Bacteroidales bacterium]|nr:ATP-binding protein [Bacteroidales bacterium]
MELVKGPIQRAQKICLYGVEGIGKSYFASKFPNPIFIDTEDGTSHMDVIRTPKPSSWTMLMSQVEYFRSHPSKLDTLVIDTLDWAEQLCVEHICSKNKKDGLESFGYGKGYVYLAEEFGRLLNALTDLIELGINIVLVAHAQMRKFEQPDELGAYDRWEMKLQKKTAPMVKEWADMVLFANYKTYVVNVDGQGTEKGKNKGQGGKRVMYTYHHPCWDAKNRHGLKPELNMDYSEIAHCIREITSTSKPPQKTAPRTETTQPPEAPPKTPPKAPPEAPPPDETKQTTTTININDIPDLPDPLASITKPLADLMRANNVTVEEIQKAVANKGYYPADTPINNYDYGFINGVLIGAWPQVFGIIKQNRANTTMNLADVPF